MLMRSPFFLYFIFRTPALQINGDFKKRLWTHLPNVVYLGYPWQSVMLRAWLLFASDELVQLNVWVSSKPSTCCKLDIEVAYFCSCGSNHPTCVFPFTSNACLMSVNLKKKYLKPLAEAITTPIPHIPCFGNQTKMFNPWFCNVSLHIHLSVLNDKMVFAADETRMFIGPPDFSLFCCFLPNFFLCTHPERLQSLVRRFQNARRCEKTKSDLHCQYSAWSDKWC